MPTTVVPQLECVVFDDDGPDVAVWGYENGTGNVVTIPIGPRNRFTPGDQGRGQPTQFAPGRLVGVFQTVFEANSGSLVWHLGADTATASSSSDALYGYGRAPQGRRSGRPTPASST